MGNSDSRLNQSYTFPRPNGETYRGPEWTDEALKAELAFLQRERIASLNAANDRTEKSVEWCEHKMMLILAELERRKKLYRKYRKDPMAPRWSNAGTKQRESLIDVAMDLKQEWPIERFLTDLMHIDLKPAGRDTWKCRCFTGAHRDNNPSMVVYGIDNHCHCFTCEFHGDIFDITRLHFGLTSFPEAVRKLADATPSHRGAPASRLPTQSTFRSASSA
jgi:hypothetical protein